MFAENFSDFADILLKIAVATVCGGILGFERETKQKPAGLKTMVFVTVGSTIFTWVSITLAHKFGGDPTRIASNIATGIGFIGAGTIIQRGVERIEGLTTAAVIWTCGAIGILIGTGYILTSLAVAGGGVVFLRALALVEDKLISRCSEFSFELTTTQKELEKLVSSYGCNTVPLRVKVREEGDGKVRVEGRGCKNHITIPQGAEGQAEA